VTGREIRLSRLFDGDGNAVVIAIDHGEFDGPLPGMIDLRETARKINPAVDAVLLAPGMLRHCGEIFAGKGRPLSIVRLNWSTVYCFHWGYKDGVTVPAVHPEEAVRLGADLVLVSLTLKTGSEAVDARNAEVFSRLVREAEALEMPVVGECFPVGGEEMSPKELHEIVFRSCRMLVELGSDAIKTFNTVDFGEVCESVPVPVLGLGASKLPTQLDALKLARAEIDSGARGVVFGRNAIQVPDPAAFQAALIDVVRSGADPAAAAKKHGLEG